MFEAAVLLTHIGLGFSGLLLAVAAMRAKKVRGLHTRIGTLYHWVFLAMAVSALVLAVLDWRRLWWFVPVAVFSYAFALLGFWAAKRRPRHWLRLHLAGQGGSFIAMCTAVLVVNLPGYIWLAWFGPTIIGAPVLVWFSRKIRLGHRPA